MSAELQGLGGLLEAITPNRLWQVMPRDLKGKQAVAFLEAVRVDDHGPGAERLIEQIVEGRLQMWLWLEGDDRCVVVVSEDKVHEDGFREFFVRIMAGTGVFELWEEFTRDFEAVARSRGADRMVAFMKPHIFQAFSQGIEKRGGDFGAEASIFALIFCIGMAIYLMRQDQVQFMPAPWQEGYEA